MTIFKELPEYPGYRIYESGIILTQWVHSGMGRYSRWKRLDSWFLADLFMHPDGYYRIPIKGRKQEFVHYLILLAFVGPKPLGSEGLHKNDIKTDNRLDNLKWGTHFENMQNRHQNGSYDVILNATLANEIRRRVENGEKQKDIAVEFKVHKATVNSIVKNKIWRSHENASTKQ